MRVTVTAIGHFDVDLPSNASKDELWCAFTEQYGSLEGWIACEHQDGNIDTWVDVFAANQSRRNVDIENPRP